ncbi:cupin domain-containing protein [Burkholderia multivorans]|uniref:cupin domain-containing protein n=1 Tax=Burkholderia multivorans TaxID=87883 RepID=UPI001C231D03|nr:cupin domain-containing protein [Burkholderia multivorans]MBU9133418.1 cupin domain-containing protein [Burkholderia multivorans]
MHKTATIDYGILVEGELWLILDKGEVRLLPGDVVVQRGTNHTWTNRSRSVARIAFILIDSAPFRHSGAPA